MQEGRPAGRPYAPEWGRTQGATTGPAPDRNDDARRGDRPVAPRVLCSGSTWASSVVVSVRAQLALRHLQPVVQAVVHAVRAVGFDRDDAVPRRRFHTEQVPDEIVVALARAVASAARVSGARQVQQI